MAKVSRTSTRKAAKKPAKKVAKKPVGEKGGEEAHSRRGCQTAGRKARLMPAPKSGVTVRMYRQGHGDCYLLAFPRQERKACLCSYRLRLQAGFECRFRSARHLNDRRGHRRIDRQSTRPGCCHPRAPGSRQRLWQGRQFRFRSDRDEGGLVRLDRGSERRPRQRTAPPISRYPRRSRCRA